MTWAKKTTTTLTTITKTLKFNNSLLGRELFIVFEVDKGLEKVKKSDWLGISLILMSMIFMGVLITDLTFQDWAFSRHQNQLSWYIRPLLIMPMMFFAYRRKFWGIGFSVFALITSMIWFPQPRQVSPRIIEFLNYEQDFLRQGLTFQKVSFAVLVLIFFVTIILAVWHRSWKLTSLILILTALLKMIWSVLDSGRAGWTILLPASLGLGACLCFVWWLKKAKF